MASEMDQILAMLRGGGQGMSMGNQLGSGNLRPPGMQQQTPYSTGPGNQLGGGIGMPPGMNYGGNDVRTPFGGGGGGISQPPGGFGGSQMGPQSGSPYGSPFTGSGYSNNVSHNGPLPMGRSFQQQPQIGGMGDQTGGNNPGILQALMHMIGGGQGGNMMGSSGQGFRSPMSDQRAYAGGSPNFNERMGYGGQGGGFGGGINPPPGGNMVYPRPNAGINPVPMGGQNGSQSLAQIARPSMRIM